MRLNRLTTTTATPSGPPPTLHRELHLRRARCHIVEAQRDLAEHDPQLGSLLDSILDALSATIDLEAATWR
jgi:hypothetical protein